MAIIILFLLGSAIGWHISFLFLPIRILIFAVIPIGIVIYLKQQKSLTLFIKNYSQKLLLFSPVIILIFQFIIFGILRNSITTIIIWSIEKNTSFTSIWLEGFIQEYTLWFGNTLLLSLLFFLVLSLYFGFVIRKESIKKISN